MKTILIDGDPLAYRAAHFARTAHDAGLGAVRAVGKLAGTLRADVVIVCLSDPTRRYWRHALYPAYKAGAADRPQLVVDALDGLRRECGAIFVRDLESDDLLGIYATDPDADAADERVVVADDKDLLTIPGRHYRPSRGEHVHVGPVEADWRHLVQTLTGDAGDGYPGCPGLGPERAPRVVTQADVARSPADAWAAVVAAFAARGLTAADALLQARLARICRAGDHDPRTGRVRPWDPPTARPSMLTAVAPPPEGGGRQQAPPRALDRYGLPDAVGLRARCARPIATGQGQLFGGSQ